MNPAPTYFQQKLSCAMASCGWDGMTYGERGVGLVALLLVADVALGALEGVSARRNGVGEKAAGESMPGCAPALELSACRGRGDFKCAAF